MRTFPRGTPVPRWTRIAALVLAALLAVARPSTAQELRGTVRIADVNTPAAGVIIEALDATTSARVSSTLTDARGYFILRLSAPGTVRVRGLRIGQRPTDFGSFTLAAGEIRTGEFTLSGAAITLERVNVVGRSVCGRARAQDQQVVTLLDEARKAIRSTQLQSTDGELSAVWTLRSQLTSLQGRPLEDPTIQAYSSATGRPFRSLPPDSLARAGYLAIQEDGYSFYAPDAEVLLSESFVESHCFNAEPWKEDDRDWVGIGFKPAETRRGVVGIRGTLWLDRRSAELQKLEYDYVNLPPVLRTPRAGGSVGFLRLDNGAWLVNEWSIRMPRVTELTGTRAAGRVRLQTRVQQVSALAVTGGDVREIRRGSELLYASRQGDAALLTITRSSEEMAMRCEEPLAAHEGVLWGLLRDSTGAAVPGRELRMEWRAEQRVLGADQRGWTPRTASVTTGGDGYWVVCGVERNALVRIAAPEALARIPADSLGAYVELRTAPAAGVATGTVYGRVTDSLRTDGAWPLAEVRVLGGAQRAVADSSGRFALEGLPPGVHELVVLDDELDLLRVPLPSARVRVDLDGSAEPALLATPSPLRHFAMVCGREPVSGEGLLVGELRDLDGIARRGLAVRATWERTLVRANESSVDVRRVESVSDSLGRFVLCGVPTDGEVSQSGGLAVYASGEFTIAALGEGLASGGVTTRLGGATLRRRDLVVASESQRRILSGVVRDNLGRPVPDATVKVADDSTSVRTNAEGRWTLASAPLRSGQLQVRALRFLPMLIDLDPVDGVMQVAEIRMENAPQVLETVNIRGIATSTTAAGFEERKKTYGFGSFLDETTLKQQAVVTAEFVASRASRVRAGNGEIGLEQAGSGFAALTVCSPRWFVDGVDFGKLPGDEQRSLLIRAVRIEIYRASLAPPQFNDFDGCGVVVVWTR
jgi:hypothetical protein